MAGGGGGSSTHKELLAAQTRVWSSALGYVRPLALMVAVQLGIPDAVHANGGVPISLSDLASAVGVAGDAKVRALRRLMSSLSHFGFFERSVVKRAAAAAGEGERTAEEDEEVYAPTVFSRCLVKDSPTTAAPFLLLMTYPLLVTSWYSMAAWFRGERPESETVFEAAHGGSTFWESLGREAEFNGLFNDAMACDARWAMAVVTMEHPEVFRGLTSLVDVGGGDGTSARAIKDAFPDMACAVLELPHVVAGSPAVEGVDFVEGDMFEHVPAADAVLLKWVLHAFDDENCVRILRRCREAVSSTPTSERGGKVIIVDMVVKDRGGDLAEADAEAQHRFALLMLANLGGTERTEVEWRRILAAAGFGGCKITPALGPRSIIEAYPQSAAPEVADANKWRIN